MQHIGADPSRQRPKLPNDSGIGVSACSEAMCANAAFTNDASVRTGVDVCDVHLGTATDLGRGKNRQLPLGPATPEGGDAMKNSQDGRCEGAKIGFSESRPKSVARTCELSAGRLRERPCVAPREQHEEGWHLIDLMKHPQ